MGRIDRRVGMKPVIQAITIAAIAALSVAGACASAGSAGHTSREACTLTAKDSVYLGGRPVYRDCAVDQAARVTSTNVHSRYQPQSFGNKCYAAEVEFVVDTAGRAEAGIVQVIRATDAGY